MITHNEIPPTTLKEVCLSNLKFKGTVKLQSYFIFIIYGGSPSNITVVTPIMFLPKYDPYDADDNNGDTSATEPLLTLYPGWIRSIYLSLPNLPFYSQLSNYLVA